MYIYIYTGVLISPQPDQEGNKLQRQEILSFIYHIYNHNCRNISTIYIYGGADKSLARPGWKQARATEDFEFHLSYLKAQLEEYQYYIYIYKTRLASNEIFSPSNKIGKQVRVKDLSAPLQEAVRSALQHQVDSEHITMSISLTVSAGFTSHDVK